MSNTSQTTKVGIDSSEEIISTLVVSRFPFALVMNGNHPAIVIECPKQDWFSVDYLLSLRAVMAEDAIYFMDENNVPAIAFSGLPKKLTVDPVEVIIMHDKAAGIMSFPISTV